MILPFGLTQKPVVKYFEGGSFHFSGRDGKLYYQLWTTIKKDGRFYKTKYPELHEVISREHLNKLLAVKSLHELRTIEEVVN